MCTLALQDIVDPDTQGTVPAGWTLGGPSAFTVVADPGPGFAGNSVRLSTSGSTATFTRSFTASGDLLIDIQLRAAQTTAAVGFHVLDAAGQPVARISLAASGKLAYTDGAAWIDSTFTYTRDSWHRITLLLHPGTGRYDLTADSRPIATPALGTASTPTSVRLNLPAGTPATFTADDILVQPTSC